MGTCPDDRTIATPLLPATTGILARRSSRVTRPRRDADRADEHPGVRQAFAATALQIDGYLAGPAAVPMTVVTQCAGGRPRAASASRKA